MLDCFLKKLRIGDLFAVLLRGSSTVLPLTLIHWDEQSDCIRASTNNGDSIILKVGEIIAFFGGPLSNVLYPPVPPIPVCRTLAYIANEGTGTVVVLDVDTNTILTTISGFVKTGPFFVTIAPDGSKVYVTSNTGNVVYVIDTLTNTIMDTVPVGIRPLGIAITPNSSKVYVTNFQDAVNSVTVIESSTHTVVDTISIGFTAFGIAITPNGAFAYVNRLTAQSAVIVIDTETDVITKTIPISSGSIVVGDEIAITPDGTKAYVGGRNPLVGPAAVFVIDLFTNTWIETINTDNFPRGIAVSPDGTEVYVAFPLSNQISIISTSTDMIIDTIVISNPEEITFTSDGRFAYVTNGNLGKVSVIDTASRNIITEVSMEAGSTSIGIDISTFCTG